MASFLLSQRKHFCDASETLNTALYTYVSGRFASGAMFEANFSSSSNDIIEINFSEYTYLSTISRMVSFQDRC